MTPRCERVSYAGWDHCLRLTYGEWELVVTLDVGPRILRLAYAGGPNLFKEFPDQLGKTSGPEWMSFGGHRLWHAPEVMPRTYAPDFDPVDHRWDGTTLTLLPPVEPTTRLRKEIHLRFTDQGLGLDHVLVNENPWAVEVAPWCLSVMAPGGRAIVPQEPFVEHGVSFEPARPLVLWQFTNMADPRFVWGERFVQLRQDDAFPSKQKVGMSNKQGWAAYALGRQLFVKTFDWFDHQTYPDLGCNCELFTMPGFLEVETLGPLEVVAPGAAVHRRETWHLFDGVDLPSDEPGLARALEPYLKDLL